MMNWLDAMLDFVDRRQIMRRFVLLFTMGMTAVVTHKAFIFASASPFDGVGTAAVLAAITAPTAALQGFAFQNYINGRKQ